MSPHLFQTTLYAALALCALGLVWRVSAWFRVQIGPDARAVTASQRMAAVFRGALSTLFSRQLFRVLGVFLLDALLQRRLYASEKLRWLAHLLAAAGFTLLVLMHALAAVVTEKLFPGYQPTLPPYLFLRNLFGAMVLIGVTLLLFGRWRRRTAMPPVRRPLAAAFVTLLAIVLVSGFLLEAHKIASPRAFYRMAEQFVGQTDAEALKPLRALWAAEFGVAFVDLWPPQAPDLLERGRELHRHACASCHAQPASAFVSYPLARALAPVTRVLDQARADVWLLYLHVFACFLGLASLPFTRFFHAVAAPLSLLVNAAVGSRQFPGRASAPGARAAQRALALDACVHCGICDAHCAVAPLARYLGNPYLLPARKLIATGTRAHGGMLCFGQGDDAGADAGARDAALRAADGAFLCTDCGRCTSLCPVGLDLEDLWQAGRRDLAAAGLAAPAQWVQARSAFVWAEYLEAVQGQPGLCDADAASAPLSSDRRSFSRCVQCQTCTNVCPVVAHSNDTEHGVDLTPQKVMNLLRLGLRDLTLGSRMVWDCATCYQCQENCPEGVRVADIMCELRALALQRLGSVRGWKETS